MGELEQILQQAEGILVCVALIVGGLQCFFGYKLFRAMTAIIGFIVGGVIGAAIGGVVAGQGGAILGLLVLGILGAVLAYSLYQLGVFVICFGAGAVVGMMLSMMMSDRVEPALVAICGLILGIVGVILTKPLIILSTGIGGGMSIGFALSMLLQRSDAGVILGVILAAVGVFLQFYLDKKNDGSGVPDAASAGGSSAAYQAASSAQLRQPGSLLSSDAVKALAADDLISRQAVCGAVVWGVLGFGFRGLTLFGIIVNLILIALGLLVGGCANRAGIEYFTFDKEDFQNNRVYIGAAIGGGIGLLGAVTLHGLGMGLIIWLIFFYVKCGAVIGYLLEMRRNYRSARSSAVPAAGSEEVPAPSSGFYNTAPAAPESSFYNKTPAAPTSSFYNRTPAAPEPGFYNKLRAEPTPTVPPAFEPAPVREDALVSSSARLWTQGLPVVVTGMSIFPAAEEPGLVSFALTFQNIGEQPVIGVYLGVKCYNLLKQELEPVEKLTIQDFVLESGESKTYTYPRALPDGDTRRVELVVRHVVMADNSTWDCEEGKILTALENQPFLQFDNHLAWQFFLDCSGLIKGCAPQSIFKYQPQKFEQHWNCACGQLNLGEICLACGIGREDLFERINPERLQKNYDLQQEEARRRAEEQQRKLDEQRKIAEEEQRQYEEEQERLEAERKKQIEAQKQAAKDAAASAGNWVRQMWTETLYPNIEKAVLFVRTKAAGFLKCLADKLNKGN